MSFIVLMALIGLGYYFLWRRGRGPEQPTVAEDLRSLFRFGKRTDSEDQSRPNTQHSGPRTDDISVRQRDGHRLEADDSLTDSKRAEEIMDLTDLWNIEFEDSKRNTETDGKTDQ